MAANFFDAQGRSVALTAAVAKTVVGVKASTNVALRLLEASCSFDGATSSNAPAVVDFNSSTFATNAPGTNSTSLTLGNTKREPGRAETIQATGASNWSAEPTVLTAQFTRDIGVFNGLFDLIFPFNSPIIVVGGQGFCITVTAANNVNVQCGIHAEE